MTIMFIQRAYPLAFFSIFTSHGNYHVRLVSSWLYCCNCIVMYIGLHFIFFTLLICFDSLLYWLTALFYGTFNVNLWYFRHVLMALFFLLLNIWYFMYWLYHLVLCCTQQCIVLFTAPYSFETRTLLNNSMS